MVGGGFHVAEQDVEPAIVVVIEDPDFRAAAVGLGDVASPAGAATGSEPSPPVDIASMSFSFDIPAFRVESNLTLIHKKRSFRLRQNTSPKGICTLLNYLSEQLDQSFSVIVGPKLTYSSVPSAQITHSTLQGGFTSGVSAQPSVR